MFCTNCRILIPEDAKCCPRCGKSVSDNHSTRSRNSSRQSNHKAGSRKGVLADTTNQIRSMMKSKDKKLIIIAIAAVLLIVILIFAFSCGKCASGNNDIYSPSSTISGVKNGALFSTEYSVEDYHNGRFIVSKLDGMLYGVLDMNGKEVLPLEYDSLEFSDDRNKFQNCIYAEFEGKQGVFDLDGKEIIPMKYDCVEQFKNECQITYAYNEGSNVYDVYNTSGDLLTTVSDGVAYTLDFIGDKYIILFKKNSYQTYDTGLKITDYSGNVVLSEDYGSDFFTSGASPVVQDNSLVEISYNCFSGGILCVVIDKQLNGYSIYLDSDDLLAGEYFDIEYMPSDSFEDCYFAQTYASYTLGHGYDYRYSVFDAKTGSIIKELGDISDLGKFYGGTAFARDIYGNFRTVDPQGNTTALPCNGDSKWYSLGDKLLYCSNETWKLVDKYGNAVGDTRYYEAERMGDKVDFYSLMNSEGECCVYSPDGRMVVPYGVLTGDPDSPYLNGSYIKECYSSFDAICFITESEDGSNVVNWYGKSE